MGRKLKGAYPASRQGGRTRARGSGLGFLFFFVANTLARGGCDSLALFVARLLVILVFACFFENAGLLKLLFETLQCAVQRFIRSNLNLRQSNPNAEAGVGDYRLVYNSGMNKFVRKTAQDRDLKINSVLTVLSNLAKTPGEVKVLE